MVYSGLMHITYFMALMIINFFRNKDIKRAILGVLPLIADSRKVFFLILQLYRPKSFIEVGVGKGDTFEQYLSVADSLGLSNIKYYGFDTFDEGPPKDETKILSTRLKSSSAQDNIWRVHYSSMETIRKKADKYQHLSCEIHLFKGNTRKTIPESIEAILPVDIIYIDGGHSYKTVKSDWHSLKPAMKTGTIIIFDDFNCEEGVSRFVGELLSHEGGNIKSLTISPASLSLWQCSTVILEYQSTIVQRQ